MSEPTVRLLLDPLGVTIQAPVGTPLKNLLFEYGVEFPCGGKGRCRGCRIRILDHAIAASEEERAILTPREIDAGWRLACRAKAECDCTIEIAQFEASILTDHSHFAFTPRGGRGVAIDLGTTTIVAQRLDLATGQMLGVRTALNPQAAHGADIMSRVQYVMHGGELTGTIRKCLHGLVRELIPNGSPNVVIVGNTVMHHLCCGIDIEPLSRVPFETPRPGLETVDLGEGLQAKFLPNLGSFVGSDILAGIVATGMHESEDVCALIDLGTNGEIVVGNKHRMLCASTAAGPAFEGGKIACGMRAQTGAISEVAAADGAYRCGVIGGVAARGICGSGLVDAVAAALELGHIRPNGRLANGPIEIAPGITVIQSDVRELQLAKGAIAAGAGILARQWGVALDDLKRIYLAGAFGNYINRTSARRIGLLPFDEERVLPAGNTALLGAKLALYEDNLNFEDLRRRVEHVPLAADAEFQDNYVSAMLFDENGL